LLWNKNGKMLALYHLFWIKTGTDHCRVSNSFSRTIWHTIQNTGRHQRVGRLNVFKSRRERWSSRNPSCGMASIAPVLEAETFVHGNLLLNSLFSICEGIKAGS
jgi:hypothetical protein